MKRLTQQEIDLIEYVSKLESHIRDLDSYLIKANGYAPDKPSKPYFDFSGRCDVMVTPMTRQEFLNEFKLERPGRIAKGCQNFFIMSKKNPLNDYQKHMAIYIDTKLLRKLFDNKAVRITLRYVYNHAFDTYVWDDVYVGKEYLFDLKIFKDVILETLPEFIPYSI